MTLPVMILYSVSSILILLSLYIAFLNYSTLWKSHSNETKGSSAIPILSGLFGAVGLLTSPNPTLQAWWWIPCIFDYLIPAIIGTMIITIFERRKP